MVTPEYRITHVINFLSMALKHVPASLCDSQLAAIKYVCAIFSKWRTVEASPTVRSTTVLSPPNPSVPLPNPALVPYPAPTPEGAHGKDKAATSKGVLKHQAPVTSKGGQVPVTYKGYQEPFDDLTISRSAPPPSPLPFEALHLPLDAPVSARTISCTVLANLTTQLRSRDLEAQILTHALFSVSDNKTGKLLNYVQLKKHPKYAETWKTVLQLNGEIMSRSW